METGISIWKRQGGLKEKKTFNPYPHGGWLKLFLTTQDRAVNVLLLKDAMSRNQEMSLQTKNLFCTSSRIVYIL